MRTSGWVWSGERWGIKRRLRRRQCRAQRNVQPDSECQRKRTRSEGRRRRKRKGVLHWDLPNVNLDLFEAPEKRERPKSTQLKKIRNTNRNTSTLFKRQTRHHHKKYYVD